MSRGGPAVLALTALALAGCSRDDRQAPVPTESLRPLPPAQEASADACGASRVLWIINTLPTDDTITRARAQVGHERIRTIRPGDAVTMDHRPDRLNIEVGEDGRIARIRCG